MHLVSGTTRTELTRSRYRLAHCTTNGPPGRTRAGRSACVSSLLAGARHVHRRGVRHRDDRLRLTAEGEPGLVVGGPRALGGVRVHTLDVHDHDLAALDLAEEDLLRQLVLDLALDGPAQRPGTQHGVEAPPGEQRLRRRR